MPAYRFYIIGPNGHISMPPTIVECADDHNAIKEGRKLIDADYIEIWQGTRVVTYPAPDKAEKKA